jgi:hypothetical protein
VTENEFANAGIAPSHGQKHAAGKRVGAAGHEEGAEICSGSPIAEQHEAQERSENYGGGEHKDEAANRKEANQGRSEEVKLFFNGEGPSDNEPGPGKVRVGLRASSPAMPSC